jgi:diguanylate cyclase (GGDEF)-like protein
MEVLPISSADGNAGIDDAPAVDEEPDANTSRSSDKDSGRDRMLAAADRAAAKIDRVAAAEDRVAASVDGLTGAYLRGPGHVELRREITRARRTRLPLALAYLDVDGLKLVNDSAGHDAGDRLLLAVATVLRDHMRAYDVIVRQGGDEFVWALPGMGMAEAKARMNLVHRALAATPVSAGIAVLDEADTLETLIGRADKALYASRSASTATRQGHE